MTTVSSLASRRGAWTFFGITVSLILAATLTPSSGRPSEELLEACLRCGSFWLQDDISNVVLFLPFGAFAVLGGWRPGRITALAGVMSVAIETAQYWLVPGRDSSLSDVVTNATGALLGAMLVYPAIRAYLARDLAARRLLRWACGGVMAFTVGISGLMLPSQASGPVWAQVEPERVGPARAHLGVARAMVDGRVVEIGRVNWTPGVRELLRRNDIAVSVDLVRFDFPRRRWALFRLADPVAPDPAEVLASRRAWLGAFAWRAEDFGLRGASVRLSRASAAQAPLTLTLERHGATMSLTETSARGRRRAATALNATMTWIPFFPGATELSGSLQWIGVAWVFGIAAMLGRWAGRSGGWWPAVDVAVALIVAGGAPALLFGLAPPPSWAWGTALVAGVLGAMLGRRSAVLHPAVSGLS